MLLYNRDQFIYVKKLNYKIFSFNNHVKHLKTETKTNKQGI